MTHIVEAAAVQVHAGGRVHFVERGAILPDGVALEVIERLVSEEMISEVDEPEEQATETIELPSDSWNHERIDAWAAEQQPPVELVNPDPTKQFIKADKLSQITAELAKRTTEQ